jgi:two-component system nitrogen regulation response regulator GlnG
MNATDLEAWIVDDDQSVRWVLEKALRQADIRTRSFERAEHLLEAIENSEPDVLITDIRMPGLDGLALLERLSSSSPSLPVIVMTAHTDLDHAVAAYRGGAFEYLPKPFDVDEAVLLVRKAARRSSRMRQLGIRRTLRPTSWRHIRRCPPIKRNPL